MDFESEPPLIMKIRSECQRKAVLYGANLETSRPEALTALFGLIGAIIISIDGGITYTEKRDFGMIMDTIKGYAADHDILGNKYSLFP